MGIQAQLDQYAIEKLPAINVLLLKSEEFESNQMRTAAIRMMNKSLPIEEMTKSQIKKFENSLIQKFLYHGWIK
tara:strand:+ start:55 stop:276 length:222 start_codon:yes stop_codon:yes gene_type:complete